MSQERNSEVMFARFFSVLLVITAVVAMLGFLTTQLSAATTAPEDEGTTIFTFGGDLPPGASLPIPLNRTNVTPANYQLDVSNDGPVEVNVSQGATALITGQAFPGETFWATGDLAAGVNTIEISNNGATTATFQLTLRTLPTTSYLWQGIANDGGEDSEIRLVFPQSGLYRFDFTATGGAYLFDLNNGDLQRQVEGANSAAFYVEAGTYPLTVQRNAGAAVDWSVNIQPIADAPFDTLPYAQEGTNISTEILPISLEEAAEVNLVITPTGTVANDLLSIQVLDPNNQEIYAGSALVEEAFWGTFDLPAGNSRVILTADGANLGTVDYELVIDDLPTADYFWSGNASLFGENSHIRVRFPEDGLYLFDYGLDVGRFQFIINEEFVRKTVEDDTADVTYFIPAGTHDLYIFQGQGGARDWSVDIQLQAVGNDSLPYGQNGGLLGGIGNAFGEEWLPLALDEPATVNMSIETTGDVADSLMVHVYEAGSPTATYTLNQVLGTEKLWGNFTLNAGINRLHIVADGSNAGAMTYDFEITAAPTNGTLNWDGNALDAGLNTAVLVDFPTTGTYRFTVAADPGFANLVLDDAMLRATNNFATPLGMVQTTYDVEVTAGEHEIYVVQDAQFPETTWTASVAPTTAVENFFTFDGNLPAGESITPLYTVPGGADREFNYELTVTGGDVDLFIEDGNGTTVANVTAYDGETLWGTGTLNGINEISLSNNGGTDIDVTLNLYDLPTAGYDWSGNADGNNMAESSHIRVIFPDNGLYTFNATNNSGRYQFVTQAGGGGPEVIRKTVENNLSVSYFVPAGTHDLFIHQDRDGVGAGPGADWALSISNVGAPNDTLPYTKVGGSFGQAGFDDFSEEWLTINLAEPTSVNLRSIASGALANTDTIMVEVMSLDMTSLLSTIVYSGETHWNTFDLPAGLHLIHIVADGTTGGLSYDIELTPLPTAPYNWSGIANGLEGQFSEARVTFPADGLYTFTFDNPAGVRHQFLINDEFVQKTVEMADSLTVFIPAGTHTLQVVPDSNGVSGWDVSISGVGAANDAFPYMKAGGSLGAGDFDEEWLPISVGEPTQVNMVMTVTGSTADFLMVDVVDGLTGISTTAEIERIYGTETFWATFDISEADRLHIMADGGNAAPLSYELEITPLPDADYRWAGLSRGNGLNSTTRMDFEANGLYRVELRVFQGLAIFDIDPVVPAFAPLAINTGYTTAITTSLSSGVHTFVVQQQPIANQTRWEMRVFLLSAESPVITGVDPDEKRISDVQTVNITGTDFQSDATVELVNGNDRYELTTQTSSETLLVVTVPDTIPLGVYDVVVTNPDTQMDVAEDAYTVIEDEAPMISAIVPNQKRVSDEQTVTITGMNFQAGLNVQLLSGANAYDLVVADSTTETITATVSSLVPIGTYDLVVLNPDDQTATLLDAYTVTPDDAPIITDVTPAEKMTTETTAVTITGENFQTGATVALVNGGNSYELNITSQNGTTLVVTVPDSIPTGTYDVVVTNPDEQTATASDAFTVNFAGSIYLPLITR